MLEYYFTVFFFFLEGKKSECTNLKKGVEVGFFECRKVERIFKFGGK